MLTPILVAGYGRSGTTAIMQLLLGDPRVAADRLYPFENRYLTYTAKLSRLAECRRHGRSCTPSRCATSTTALRGRAWPANREPGECLAVPPEELFRLYWSA